MTQSLDCCKRLPIIYVSPLAPVVMTGSCNGGWTSRALQSERTTGGNATNTCVVLAAVARARPQAAVAPVFLGSLGGDGHARLGGHSLEVSAWVAEAVLQFTAGWHQFSARDVGTRWSRHVTLSTPCCRTDADLVHCAVGAYRCETVWRSSTGKVW